LHFLGEYAGIAKAWMPFFPFRYPYQEVRQGTEGLVERFGRYIKTLQPGYHFVNPYTEKLINISLLTQ
jgi:erythrocyte band 7 integral membrane protein